jgi:hypothetical protein
LPGDLKNVGILKEKSKKTVEIIAEKRYNNQGSSDGP